MQPIDVFLDCSARRGGRPPGEAPASLDVADLLGAIDGRVYCAAPRTRRVAHRNERLRILEASAVEVLDAAMAAAAAAERALLVLLGDVEPEGDALGVLLDAIDEDPLIGFAVPRVCGSRGDGLAIIDAGGDRAIADLPRRLLAEVPATYLVADAPARCVLIKPQVVANFSGLDTRFRSAAGALWHYMGRVRRCGFRTVLCNRAVVGAREGTAACVIALHELPEADRVLLRELLPEVERAQQEFGTRQPALAETRLARALPEFYDSRPSLLLDLRNIGRDTNGTAIAALGIAGGLHALADEWEVAVLARGEACVAHRLEDRLPRWQVYTSIPDRQFTAALRLSQPWHVQEMIELHGLAAYNLYLFLDTISWDVAYAAPRHLDATWHFMADHADGLVFISEFTRDRFRRRFSSARTTPTLVSHLSFSPADYIDPQIRAESGGEGPLFIVGNAYHHKDVAETLGLLAAAFPYEPIVALGPVPAPTSRVTVLESGSVTDAELHRLYAGARAVVFPSFYEGFGFPIVTALAYGRTLLARRSALLEELAVRLAPGGRLAAYDRRDELVEFVGRVLHGEDVPDLRVGLTPAGAPPPSWLDVANAILRFTTDLSGDLSRSRWRSRGHTVRQLLAARGDSAAC